MTTTTRSERIRAIAAVLDLVGGEIDTGFAEALEDPSQYLLVERNVGTAADSQSHWFSTHESVDAAAAYHAGQEYPEGWQVEFAVDLDTGESYPPKPFLVVAVYAEAEGGEHQRYATDVRALTPKAAEQAAQDICRRDNQWERIDDPLIIAAVLAQGAEVVG